MIRRGSPGMEIYATSAQLKRITDEAKKDDSCILAPTPTGRRGDSWHAGVMRKRKALPKEVERVTFKPSPSDRPSDEAPADLDQI